MGGYGWTATTRTRTKGEYDLGRNRARTRTRGRQMVVGASHHGDPLDPHRAVRAPGALRLGGARRLPRRVLADLRRGRRVRRGRDARRMEVAPRDPRVAVPPRRVRRADLAVPDVHGAGGVDRLLPRAEGHGRLLLRHPAPARRRALVDDDGRRDPPDPARHLGDGVPGPLGRAAAPLDRHRRDHPRHRRDRRWRSS